ERGHGTSRCRQAEACRAGTAGAVRRDRTARPRRPAPAGPASARSPAARPAIRAGTAGGGACGMSAEYVPVRMLVLWCPDWPVVAAASEAGLPVDEPAAVLVANRVVACSAVARAVGVRRGMRRREAQFRCPELAVFADDPDRDARL